MNVRPAIPGISADETFGVAATPNTRNADRLLTVDEVARFLNVPRSWVYDHVRPGAERRLPHVKLGKYLRFSLHEIARYVATLRREQEDLR